MTTVTPERLVEEINNGYSSPFRIPGAGDRIPALPGDDVPRGPEKWHVNPPRRDRLVYADRGL